MKRWSLILTVGITAACNPFAPGLDSSEDDDLALVGDPTTIDGVFQNIRYSYTFRDTTIYGQLLDDDYTFIYRDYDRGVDVSWGRDEEIRTTHGLFQNVQRLDLVWNNIVSVSTDSLNTLSTITRNFNLTVTFNPSDIERIDGYANLSVARANATDPWRIVRWRDESNF
ncbi:MAG: hypothetical protein L0Y80_02110 [Ignavibacteriae bacterium]|nr:hypothetical protein [Ignavibacteriota bacterium]